MTSSGKNWLVLSLAIVVSGIPAMLYLDANGISEASLNQVLSATAWLALILYLAAFVARPLNQLVAAAPTRALLRQRRLWGVAFAGVHSVHLVIIIWTFYFVFDVSIPAATLAGGGLAYLLMYGMLITSFDGPARALGRKWWRRLHRFGLYWIGLIFAYTLLPAVFSSNAQLVHFILAGLTLVAIAIRLAAWFRSRKGSLHSMTETS